MWWFYGSKPSWLTGFFPGIDAYDCMTMVSFKVDFRKVKPVRQTQCLLLHFDLCIIASSG